MSPGAVQVVLVSFGYLHGAPPAADVTVDVRDSLCDPYADPAVRELTGLDLRVRDRVLSTVGAVEVVHRLAALAETLLLLRSFPDRRGQYAYTTVAVGCAGGRHRGVALVDLLAALLRAAGWEVAVEHRDAARPVLRRELPPGGDAR